MHVTPEPEVLGSNAGGVGTQCPRCGGICDPASQKGCREGQVGITVTLEFRRAPEHFTFTFTHPYVHVSHANVWNGSAWPEIRKVYEKSTRGGVPHQKGTREVNLGRGS